MLGFVEQVNPNFYPVPLAPPERLGLSRVQYGRVAAGFLTRNDFVALYDASAAVLHSRNPYDPRDATIDVRYPPAEWSNRIKTLLRLHLTQLVDVHGIWVVTVRNEGPVEALPAMADGPFVVEPV